MRRLALQTSLRALATGLVLAACSDDTDDAPAPGGEDAGPGTGSSSGTNTSGGSGSTSSSSGDAAAAGAPTRLDPTCGGTGRVVFRGGVEESVDVAHSVKRRADGSTLFIGTVDEPEPVESIQSSYFASMRLLSDCSVDTSWGANGMRFFTVSNPDFHAQRLGHVQFLADGTALLLGGTAQDWLDTRIGETSNWFALTAVRLGVDGSHDTGFGAPFLHVLVNDDDEYPTEFTVKSAVRLANGDTRVLLQTGGPYMTFGLATLRADGTFDPAATQLFARDGIVSPDYEPWRIRGLQVLADGSSLVSGTFEGIGNTSSQMAGILKIKADGTVDTTFGTRGVAGLGTDGGPETRTEMRVTADGKIVLASVINTDDAFNVAAVMRFDASGVIDPSFGQNGVTSVDLGLNHFGGYGHPTTLKAFELAADGSMYFAGEIYSQESDEGRPEEEWHVAATHFLANGQLDTAFGTGGVFNAATLSAGAGEHLEGMDVDEQGTVTLTATRELSQWDSDWVVYRLTRQP